VEALLAPYKRYAEIKAEIAFAEAAISFAYGNFASGAKFLAAGVAWTAVAGLIGAAGSLIGGSGTSAASSVGAGSSSNANNNNGPRIFYQDSKPAQVQIIVRPEPGTIVEHVVNDYRNNGRVRQVFGGNS
jgi:ABC-type Fe3+ transport system substrate-binding protein